MKIAALFALSLSIAVALVAQDTAPVIEHDPSRCFEVGSFPRLCAQVTADGSLGQARAYFRASRTTKWYYVDLAEEEGELCSALPSPLPETSGVEYYLEVLDEQFRSAITPTAEARVVSDGSCGMPVYETAGVVSVFSLATGLLEVPAGFAATSVATAGGASGAGAAGGAAGGGGGGGLSGVAIGAIAGGAGAAAVAGVAVSRGGSDSSLGPTGPTGSITFVTASPPPGSTVPVQPDGSMDLTMTVSVVYSESGSYVLHAFSDVFRANTGPACTSNFPVQMNLQSDQPSIINNVMHWVGDSLPECSRPVRVQCMVFQILEGPGQFINPLVNECLPVNYTFVDR